MPGVNLPTVLALLLLACAGVRLGLAQSGAAAAAPSPGEVLVAKASAALREGSYEQVLELAVEAETVSTPLETWALFRAEAQRALGRYDDAAKTLDDAIGKDVQSLRLRWAARELAVFRGDKDAARRLLLEMAEMVSRRRWAYRDPPNLVIFGRVALALGADPKDVLDRVFASAQTTSPGLRDVYLARGELALDKQDYDLAARAFGEGLEKVPGDPELLHGLARAYAESSRGRSIELTLQALGTNPRHVPSLLLLADQEIDAEDYVSTEERLGEVAAINPHHPDLSALRAVLAYLRHDDETAEEHRRAAFRAAPASPRVDHLIGRKLSRKYRFAEGAAAQRRALALDVEYLPAQAQLASDLLRLGQEEEGWRLIGEVHERDGYDVEAYNLVTLRDTLAKYRTLANADFSLRMTTREAEIYGPRVLDLLTRAKAALVERYGAELVAPTIVDLFGDEKDFAVRTFGLPDIEGFLGVCFGRVITANSPAATGAGRSVNWESVLWHEFCHVVTLQFTKNRIPRWLSEGISVYEERRADPGWGSRMTPRFHEMILGGQSVPVGRLSALFLAPPTPEHVQLAYYQSSLVVEYLVETFGFEALKGVLRSLRVGVAINDALERHAAPLERIEREFADYQRGKALAFAAPARLAKPPAPLLLPGSEEALRVWQVQNPESVPGLVLRARAAGERRDWAEARELAARAVELIPDHTGADGPYPILADALRELGEREAEWELLARWTPRTDGAAAAYLRQMELAAERAEWAVAARAAERFLAVNPLTAPPYRHLSESKEGLGDLRGAIAAAGSWLLLDPPNPGEVHFRLARLLARAGDPGARHHLLRTLEDAPRHREALALLLTLGPRAEEALP
jgi:tetratricopeptide (TPR) repeat protein